MEKRALGTHFIRSWRRHRGLSLAQLADLMEHVSGERMLTPMSISRIERFQQPYTQETLEAFSEALSCSKSDLLEIDPERDVETETLLAAFRDLTPAERTLALKLIAVIGADD